MVITVTLNPCIDRTVWVEGFTPGKTNRVAATRCDVAGKGVNVGIALKNLGEEPRCIGFNFKGGGALLPDMLGRLGISNDFADVGGELRTNTKIFDTSNGIMSELNETGTAVEPDALEQLEKILERDLPKASLLILNGSVPPGVPGCYYRMLAERAARHGVRTVIDASGELLLEGIQAHPCLIKPNRDELEGTFGEAVSSREDAVRIARKITRLGVGMVCVSLGEKGALLVAGDEVYDSAGAELPVRGVQGAGDSMVAGMSYALVRGMPPGEILRYGVAAANASLILEGTQMCSRADFTKMLPLVSVKKLN